MRLPHRLQGQKVKSEGGAGAYCGGDLAAQLVSFASLPACDEQTDGHANYAFRALAQRSAI